MSQHNNDPILKEIIEITGKDPAKCYQCGKCSAGCPIRDYEDVPPNRVIRYVQLGLYDKALSSSTIWMCAGCLTCSSRCPNDFEPAKFMDALREIAIKKNIIPADKKVQKFHKAFLDQIKANGRGYEVGLVAEYKLLTGALMQDVDVAPTMFFKGKLGLLPKRIKNTEKIKKIFKNFEKEGK